MHLVAGGVLTAGIRLASLSNLVPLLFLTLYQLRFPKLHISPCDRFPAEYELLMSEWVEGNAVPGLS